MFCSFLVGSTHEPPVYKGKALKRDGLYYAPNSTEPLTANVEEYYDSGALNRTFTLIAGKKEGVGQWWHENGQLRLKGTYVDGREEGLHQRWDDNGQRPDFYHCTLIQNVVSSLLRVFLF
tara:strand:+ start:185 stop:544 length:360 start_codon:yes stop_codon:yes gene_type:complete